MSDQIENQYRFMLESKARVIVKYQVDIADPDKPKIVFDGYSLNEGLNSNQLNRFIAASLNDNTSQTYGPPEDDPNKINRTANIKFKIPCVGYFNNGYVLPEFFIKHYEPTPPDIAFDLTKYESTLDMESNLYVNCNLNVADDITAFATYHSSDINLKKNINTLTNCYDVVNDLNPVGFKWIKNNKENVGFIAQEVEQIIPNIVSNTDEYKTIAETKIIAYLVGAIQELDKELKELEEE
tara:strand:+ start:42 stop:758 length:717 start_codon:yes stop_codon:yes gene_type:complete